MTEMVILRHAAAAEGASDFRRSLTGEGWRRAEAAAEALVAGHFHVGRALCSPALRARETLAPLRSALHIHEADILFERSIYNGGGEEVMRLVEEHLPAAPLLIVGHNPSLEQLASWLVGRPVPLGAGDWVRLRFDGVFDRGAASLVDSFRGKGQSTKA